MHNLVRFRNCFAVALLLSLLAFSLLVVAQNSQKVDVCVYGGTAAGVMAAYTAKKAGKSVLLIEPGKHLGGLTTGGLGYTDIGNKYVVTGLSRDFYRRIGQHYGKFEQWVFEPSVAEKTIMEYVHSAGVPVLYQNQLIGVNKRNGTIQTIILESTTSSTVAKKTINAKIFIDCSYEGDLMAKAGVFYTVGREANSQYNETHNGVQVMNTHQFPDGVDPYVVPGDSTSGLLWGISPGRLQERGSGDTCVQAYNFRICLTNKPENRIVVTQPDDYDTSRYELLVRYLEKKKPVNLEDRVLNISAMPNGKTDINNNGPFSTDMIGANHTYPDADYQTRQRFLKELENYTKGLLYFLSHSLRVPEHLRNEMLQWGYSKDEYTDNNHWSPQAYIREARRMVGEYVMTQRNCEGREIVADGVGMAAYTMDSHNCQRLVVNGMVKNEGDVQIGGFGPYPVSYRSLLPKATECKNLLVPVCLSASHIAYGSIRMEPVFMVLAQSAAVAAVMAISSNTSLHNIDVKKLQQTLKQNPLADSSSPELLVDNDDAENTVVNGDWRRITKGGYGPSFYIDSADGTTAKSVRFVPNVQTTGRYKVYVYFPKLQGAAEQTNVTMFDGSKRTNKTVHEAAIKVEGQTSGEWVFLDAMNLPKGKAAFIEISNRAATGLVAADAVLFVPENRH